MIHSYKLVSVLHYATTNNSNQTIMYKLIKFTIDGSHVYNETVVIPLITFANTNELEQFIICCRSYVASENIEYKRICSPTRISLKLIPVEPINVSTAITLMSNAISTKISKYNDAVNAHNTVLTRSNKKRHKPLKEGHVAEYNINKIVEDRAWIKSDSYNGIISIA